MPTTPEKQRQLQAAALKQARERHGWSQTDLEAKLRAVARRMGLLKSLPYSSKTLIAYISYFENGKRSIPEKLRPIYREALQASDEELGFASTTSVILTAPHASQLTELPAAAGLGVIANLKTVLTAHLSMEALVGPRYVIPAVLGHLPLIEQLYRVTRGPDRYQVLRFASKFVEFCGWLYQDSGDYYCAMQLTNKASDYAAELNDPHVTSYVLMRKSNIASDSGQPGHALGLANAALAETTRLTPRLRAVALRQQANAFALLGERAEFTKTLDAARTEAHEGLHQEEDDRAPYCTPAYVEMEAGAAWLTLNEPSAALPIFETARANWIDGTQGRDQALCLTRTAAAYAAAGDRHQACNLAQDVITQTQGLSSARVLEPLSRLRDDLAPWSHDTAVGDLVHRLDLILQANEPSASRPEGLA
jgi:transcriptional regulator with XRE-family HTH domain